MGGLKLESGRARAPAKRSRWTCSFDWISGCPRVERKGFEDPNFLLQATVQGWMKDTHWMRFAGCIPSKESMAEQKKSYSLKDPRRLKGDGKSG